MPWCPKCKNEYREGITVCVDCNEELVEDLSVIEAAEKKIVFTTEQKEKTDAFIKYLEYSGIHSYSVESDENDFVWSLYVSKDDYKKASKLFTGFAITESERAITEQSIDIIASDEEILPDDLDYSDIVNDISNENNDNDILSDETDSNEDIETIEESAEEAIISQDAQDAIDELNERLEFNEMTEAPVTTYVRKSEKAQDYLSSAYTCLVCGIGGLIFVVLNMVDIISLISSLFSQIVFFVLFAAFFIIGIKMLINSKSITKEVDSEEAMEKSITEWLDKNITEEYLAGIRDENASDELNYFNYFENIKNIVYNEFKDADQAMIEALVDEHLAKFN